MSAGYIRTSRATVNPNEAVNQQLTAKRAVEGESLDNRLAVVESEFGGTAMLVHLGTS